MKKILISVLAVCGGVMGAQHIGCTSDQQSQIASAISNAETYIADADNYIVNLNSDANNPRYTTWFGAYDAKRHAYVSSVFNNILNNDLSTFIFDCSTCVDPDLYGYVYPDQFGTIYLCPLFWKAPITGTYSKAGELVGLTSQFLANGGIQNHEYGKDDCKQLAISNPDNAITNADSYNYFAENNPPLA